MAESCSHVDSDLADVAPPCNSTKNGKRDADEVVDYQVVCNKKHKAMDKTNCGMEIEENITESSQAEVPIDSATTMQDETQRVIISNEYTEEDKDDSLNEDHQHVETPNKSALKVNNDLETERDEHYPSLDTGSKTLFLGNLHFSIEEDDVRDFFKDIGEIAEIRFAIKDERFKGYGYIEFNTVKAAQEALKLNKQVLLDRRVSLEFARRQRGAYTPGNSISKSNQRGDHAYTPVNSIFKSNQRGDHAHTPVNSIFKPNQRGDHAQWKTVYVRGFETSEGYVNIWNTLEKQFGKCGEISRMYIPKDYVSGAPKGVAFIEFTDRRGFSQALELNGSEIGDNRLTVEEAKRPRGDNREGSGYGSGGWSGSGGDGWSRSGGSRSGPGGGWSGSVGVRSGSSDGWVKESSYGRESGSGGHWSGSRGGGSGSGGGRSGYGSCWSGSGGGSVRESSYGREWSGRGCSGSGGGYGSTRVESGYNSRTNTKSGPDDRWHRESGFGGGLGRGRGFNNGGFSSNREINGSGYIYNRYNSSHHGRGGSFVSGSYNSRQHSRP